MKAYPSLILAVRRYLQDNTHFSEIAISKFIKSQYFYKWIKEKHGNYTINHAIEDFEDNTKYLDNNLVDYF